ncbi:hypothetical protein RKD23_007757 [Streptomyces sp. SAI-170]|uniref:hypothetical protein n=1 Tax=Streptomyces sp. SAI-170 TaxID=3377729 RepID=UPI003C7C84BA
MKELTGDGVPVTIACRVLKRARQPYYRWLAQPVTDAMLEEAYRANALLGFIEQLWLWPTSCGGSRTVMSVVCGGMA